MLDNINTASARSGQIDPYALFEALTGRKIDKDSLTPESSGDDYDDLREFSGNNGERPGDGGARDPQGDHAPRENEVNIGAINPYALVEALLGHKLDRRSLNVARIISDTLQTDYDELFDLKHNSVLFAGVRLNGSERRAEQLRESDIRILDEQDLATPDLSQVRQLRDLEEVGFKDLDKTRIKMARMQNGKLQVVLDARHVARTVSNQAVTETLSELVTRYRRNRRHQNNNPDDRRDSEWNPPNSTWRNIDHIVYEQQPQKLISDLNRLGLRGLGSPSQDSINYNIDNSRLNRFDDPVQGAASNSWLIAAIFSVFWANPAIIRRASHTHPRNTLFSSNGCSNDDQDGDNRHGRLHIPFYDKGGRNNARSTTVEVDYEVPVNRSSNDPIYARASGESDIWPSLYEKAFAKWITGSSSDRPDITQTAYGDPIKAMAQINDREPRYYYTDRHEARDLVGVVRNSSVNQKTIHPMAAYTHATGSMYRGANLVANHAYSVLGWTSFGERQYIVVRNPWGVTEPAGLTCYPGVIDRVESELWQPAYLVDGQGLLAIEAHAFREYFAAIGVAK